MSKTTGTSAYPWTSEYAHVVVAVASSHLVTLWRNSPSRWAESSRRSRRVCVKIARCSPRTRAPRPSSSCFFSKDRQRQIWEKVSFNYSFFRKIKSFSSVRRGVSSKDSVKSKLWDIDRSLEIFGRFVQTSLSFYLRRRLPATDIERLWKIEINKQQRSFHRNFVWSLSVHHFGQWIVSTTCQHTVATIDRLFLDQGMFRKDYQIPPHGINTSRGKELFVAFRIRFISFKRIVHWYLRRIEVNKQQRSIVNPVVWSGGSFSRPVSNQWAVLTSRLSIDFLSPGNIQRRIPNKIPRKKHSSIRSHFQRKSKPPIYSAKYLIHPITESQIIHLGSKLEQRIHVYRVVAR